MKSSLGILANLFVVGLMILAGCTKAQVSVIVNQPTHGGGGTGIAISSTRESLGTASGIATDGTTKIKFSIGYNQTGPMTTDGSVRVRAVAPEVAHEE